METTRIKTYDKVYDKYTEEIKLPRATIRRANKSGIHNELLNELTQLVLRKVMKIIVDHYSVAVAYTLWHKFGYGPKRLPEVMAQIEETFEAIEMGYLSVDDCKKDLEDSTGVRITDDTIFREGLE